MPSNQKHQPVRFDTYLGIHETYIGRLRAEGFVGEDTLEFRAFGGGIRLQGEIACLGCIVLTVDKFLKIVIPDPPITVQTVIYEYNASVRGYGNFIRYDNSHSRPGHADNHHRHEFTWQTKDQSEGHVTWVGESNWPTLGQVIDEVRGWYWDHYSELGEVFNPDSFPSLGLR